MFITLSLAFSFAAFAGKLRYPETKPIVIDSPGKICVSSGQNEVGAFYATCRANTDGTCPETTPCAEDPEVQPKEGKVKKGKYDPGKPAAAGGATGVGGDSRGNRAN